MVDVTDRWAAGSTYEDFMGRWSRVLAPIFINWLQVPENSHWLDVGCGTGALTDAICSHANPASVIGCDPAKPLLDYAQRHQSSPRASFLLAGAGSLPSRPDGSDGSDGFDSVTSSFALNFLPEPLATVEEMRTITSSRGTVSACVWDYSGRMEFLRYFWDAAFRIDPKAIDLDEGVRFPICRREALAALFREAGLSASRCEAIEIDTDFSSFEEFWHSFQAGTGPAPSYVANLEDGRRAALAKELENALPKQSDGSIHLVARAWAVQGTVS
jgi:SAM-dependent methyltransferase